MGGAGTQVTQAHTGQTQVWLWLAAARAAYAKHAVAGQKFGGVKHGRDPQKGLTGNWRNNGKSRPLGEILVKRYKVPDPPEKLPPPYECSA